MGQLICIFSATVSQQNLNKHYSGSRRFVQPCTTYSLLIWDTTTMILCLIKLWGIPIHGTAVISQQELEKSSYKVPDTLYKFVPLMLHLFGVVWSWTTPWSSLKLIRSVELLYAPFFGVIAIQTAGSEITLGFWLLGNLWWKLPCVLVAEFQIW